MGQTSVDTPISKNSNVDDLLCHIKRRVQNDQTMSNNVFFTNDGRAFVVGIIDSLTEWSLKK